MKKNGTMRQAEAYITTRLEEETAYIGELFGRYLDKPLVVALQGELGAGKTVFTRGAARGLEVTDRVSSPTFVLLKIYNGRLPVYHFDFYRLSSDEDIIELGFDEYLPGDGIAFIEWPERLPDLLPPEYLKIDIELFYDEKGEGRRIRFTPHGTYPSKIVETVIENITWHTDGTLNVSRGRFS
ncbi:MAG: tRNA (adenosine(37)-N6)-threonylcarbamoyltransferase complex ATPase subunit type 1 TsaE [Bacillota bacterium]|nr:tRNA (adenosine(37)-N6)-threonylcarbamoyltransferase complex ATPase subunit type 1 TsaE [Bacillota bacterium]